jgi:hypothetical protein
MGSAGPQPSIIGLMVTMPAYPLTGVAHFVGAQTRHLKALAAATRRSARLRRVDGTDHWSKCMNSVRKRPVRRIGEVALGYYYWCLPELAMKSPAWQKRNSRLTQAIWPYARLGCNAFHWRAPLTLLIATALLLLSGVLRRLREHLHGHTLLIGSITGRVRTSCEPPLDLIVLLDERAARTPVRRAAVACAIARNAEALSDLVTLEHDVTCRVELKSVLGFKVEKSRDVGRRTSIHSQ